MSLGSGLLQEPCRWWVGSIRSPHSALSTAFPFPFHFRTLFGSLPASREGERVQGRTNYCAHPGVRGARQSELPSWTGGCSLLFLPCKPGRGDSAEKCNPPQASCPAAHRAEVAGHAEDCRVTGQKSHLGLSGCSPPACNRTIPPSGNGPSE